MLNTVRHLIDTRADEHSDRVFVTNPELKREVTYAALKTFADELGARLDQLNIPTGGKVAFLLDNGALVAPLFLGVMASARVVVPLNAVSGPTQLQHVLEHSDCELIFVAPHYREQLAGLLAKVARDIRVITASDERGLDWDVAPAPTAKPSPPTDADPALLLYTSGSTGKPKGALLSHAAVVAGGRNVVAGHGLTAQDRTLCVLPVYHINGAMVTVCAPLVSGGSVVMPRRFSARAFWQTIAEYQCTWTSVVPTIINYLLDRAPQESFNFGDDAQLKNFRFARSASAPLPATVLQQWEKIFKVPMIETLGLTETAGTVATNPMPPAASKLNSVGKACGVDIKIIDEHCKDCATDCEGEIAIRGASLLGEYYKDTENTRAAFIGDWFRTGDVGHLDADDYLFITGRIKELILRGGENIAPREIDAVLYKHEAILEAAAVGVDHPNYGQEVVACVALRDGFECTERELIEFCVAKVGDVKAPKSVYFLDELPKGPSGKILRLALPKVITELTLAKK